MPETDLLTMSTQELDRLKVVQRVIERRLTQIQASQQLGITTRQMSRLIGAYKTHGPEALVSKKRGKRSNRAYPDAFKQQVLTLIRDNYHDFGPTLIAEKLVEKHDIELSDETIRR